MTLNQLLTKKLLDNTSFDNDIKLLCGIGFEKSKLVRTFYEGESNLKGFKVRNKNIPDK